jgi:NADH-ubiquinone oxidoreductase chain 1
MVAGWYSKSNYPLLGALHAVAQSISYEVSLSFILLYFIFLDCRYDLLSFYYYQVCVWLIFFSFL